MTEIEKVSAAAEFSVGQAVANPTPEPAPMPPAVKKTRAPGAGRPPLNPPTERVWGRIPAALLPELERRGGAARILIDALSKKSN